MEGSVDKSNGKTKDRNSLNALEFSCPTASQQGNCKKRKRSAPDLSSETKQRPRRIRRHSECTSRDTQVSLSDYDDKHITDAFSGSRLKVKPEAREAFKSTYRDGEMERESRIGSFISFLGGDHQYGIPRGGMHIFSEENLHADSRVKRRRVSVGGPVLQREARSINRRNRRGKCDFGAPDAVCCVNCPECESALNRRKQSAPELALGHRHVSAAARRQSDFVLGGWSKRDRCRRCRRFRSHSTLVERGVQSVQKGPPEPACCLETGGGDAGQLSDVERGGVSVEGTRRLVAAAVAAERRRHSVRLPMVGFLVLLCAFAAFVIAVSVRMTPPARAGPDHAAPKEYFSSSSMA